MFNWIEYLNLASYLYNLNASSVNQEAIWRCSVSRAYYASFGEMRRRAKMIGFKEIKGRNIHKELVNFIKDSDPQLANHLNDLRIWRNQCDYDNPVKNLNEMAKNALRKANKILKSSIM